MSSQRTLFGMWGGGTPQQKKTASTQPNRNLSTPKTAPRTGASKITPEQKERSERSRQAAMARLQKSQFSPIRNKSNPNQSHLSTSSSITPSDRSGDVVTHSIARNRRKRSAAAAGIRYCEDNDNDSETSPIQPLSKRRRRNHSYLADDDDDDYEPNGAEISAQLAEDKNFDTFNHSPPQKVSPQRRLQRKNGGNTTRVGARNRMAMDIDDDDGDDSPFRNSASAAASTSAAAAVASVNASGDSLDHMSQFTRPMLDNVSSNSDAQIARAYDSTKRLRQLEREQKSGGRSKKEEPSKNDVRNEEWYLNPSDLSGLKQSDPGYNPSEIRVPPQSLQQMTPAHKQYWQIKSTHNDGVLFFKLGKFYELFFKDADLGHELLGLEWMKADIPHVGFPETSFNKYAEAFVKYGYKIYRIEQMETPVQAKQRQEAEKKKGRAPNKTVARQVCEVLTKGTITDPDIIGEEAANILLSISESRGTIEYAIAFTDCSTGEFHVGHFSDDRNRTRLRTLLVQIRPAEVLFDKTRVSDETLNVFKTDLRDASKTCLAMAETYTAERTRSELADGKYWETDEIWPPLLKNDLVWHSDPTMTAIGHLFGHLRRTYLDTQILPNSVWRVYDPVDKDCNDYLMLDGSTLSNLEILENEDNGLRGTLMEFVNKTVTPFGFRRMKTWLRAPLNKIADIEERLIAIESLNTFCEWSEEVRHLMRGLPDLERLLLRISALGTRNRRMDAAVMFDDAWKVKKVKTFCKVLTALSDVKQILATFEEHRSDISRSKLLNNLTTIGLSMPDYEPVLRHFIESFDHKQAETDGVIRPASGADDKYDSVIQSMAEIKVELDSILDSTKAEFRDRNIKWYHPKKGKSRYQIELSVNTVNRIEIPDDWTQTAGTKAVHRYHSPEILGFLPQLEDLEDQEERLLRDSARATFARFAENAHLWRQVVDCVADLDCLLSLAHVSKYAEFEMSRPIFVDLKDAPNGKPFLDLRHSRHPCIDASSTITGATQFIPNNVVLGCEENPSRFVIVTGPNMGGKSTLLRQTCIAVILAHVGCYVPASLCRLTPVDRIFTRVGANDRIMAGQSTFMVELEETANILNHSTENSLVILDELGRGTSTHDGTAIAYSVANYLIDSVDCRCLFSTHYHGLCESFDKNVKVAMYHMAFDEDSNNHKITFLYEFRKGVCKQSHGINCGRLAGLDESILERAALMSSSLHNQMHGKQHADEMGAVSKQFEEMMTGLILDDYTVLNQLSNAMNTKSDDDDLRQNVHLINLN